MDLFLGLLALAGLSLFLSTVLKKSSAITPLLSVSIAMLWFTLWGCIGLLQVGGWAWYALCAAALGYVVITQKQDIKRFITPGFVFFVAGSAVFILLFFFTKPLLTQWDEFTFWGTTAKVTTNTNQLYTTASSNLIARSYPPGITVFNYMMQFFGGAFAEYKLIASYSIVYLSALAVPSALWKHNRSGSILFLAGMFGLPFLFETLQPGQMSWAYLSCMGDLPMAALFGGALCFYFSGGTKDHKLLLGFGVILAALVNSKDMGLALACIAWFVALVDMIFCERQRTEFFRLQGGKAIAAASAVQFAMIGSTYFVWARHLATIDVNRTDFGSAGQSLSPVQMLSNGVLALLRIKPDAAFDDRLMKMLDAFLHRRVWLFGSGVRMLLVIVAILALVWFISKDKRRKRQVLVFAIAMSLCFVAFYLFNTMTYTYILKGEESLMLKDYDRYIFPFWFGWLMASASLLVKAANGAPAVLPRVRIARLGCLFLSVCILGGVLWRFNWQANFAAVSPSLYGQRISVKQAVQQAQAQGMQPQHKVYLISQGDDATRFYLYGYEMEAELEFLFGGIDEETGKQKQTTAASLVPFGTTEGYTSLAPVNRQQLVQYLAETGCDHILLDVTDEYILQEFGPLFSDKLQGWSHNGLYQGGLRYYAIHWQQNEVVFRPVAGGGVAS